MSGGGYQAGRWALIDETGNVHGCWVVVSQAMSGNGARWRCRCSVCGADGVFYGYALRAGVVPECKHEVQRAG